ncbi:SUMO1 sentrin specific peptidase 1 [Coemansia sp. RSA 2711]|nr:SUMO1 sentrin specific peptidase 1 [Coemansia sp. RSA 2711]
MASSGTKRPRASDSLDIPGGFPQHHKLATHYTDDGWLVHSKPTKGEGFMSFLLSPIRRAAIWLVGSKPPASTPAKPQASARQQRTKDRIRQANGTYEHQLRERQSQKRRRRGASAKRKSLIGAHSHSSRARRNQNLVRDYTVPTLWSADAARYREPPAPGGNLVFESTPSRSYITGDTQSVLSIDSSLSYRQMSPLAARTPAKGDRSATDQWVARLRKKIEDTLSVAPPATRIATPAYDRLEQAAQSFDARIARARAAMAFTLPDNAPAVLAQAKAGGFAVELNNVPVSARDMSTLGDGQWLNDEVINFYMQLLIDRSQRTPTLPRVHAFNTFFYSTLNDNGYARVRRWTRRVKLFEMDLVVVPVHLGVHWCCAIIDFRKRTIFYYDALLGDNPKCLRTLLNYLHEESKDKLAVAFDESGWTLACPKDIPRQRNGYDCGVFAVMFAEYVTRDAPFAFSQDNCQFLRSKIAYEIATKTLVSAIA